MGFEANPEHRRKLDSAAEFVRTEEELRPGRPGVSERVPAALREKARELVAQRLERIGGNL
ncbi:hypothetical protein ABZW96_27345 [Nocardia sp. NPDC004168]|uniref:hypothetical protein n=1 Tax=Nocardia sp. NPDC004168 TaxID=3154452 RepID=UPI0033AB70AE